MRVAARLVMGGTNYGSPNIVNLTTAINEGKTGLATLAIPTGLNFGILKRILFRPTLLDQYRTGPGDDSLIKIASRSIGIASKVDRTIASSISKSRIDI